MPDELKKGKIVVVHEKHKCIGCGSCVAIASKFWEMDSKTTKAHLIGSRNVGENEELDIEEADVQQNQDAADVCPVNCIHLKRAQE